MKPKLDHCDAIAGWSSIKYDEDTGATLRIGTIWIWRTK